MKTCRIWLSNSGYAKDVIFVCTVLSKSGSVETATVEFDAPGWGFDVRFENALCGGTLSASNAELCGDVLVIPDTGWHMRLRNLQLLSYCDEHNTRVYRLPDMPGCTYSIMFDYQENRRKKVKPMIKTNDAIRIARSLIGTPYSELDCINLIKKVIRTAPGGVPGYTTAGTNALWDSYNMSAKYKDLTWRQESIAGARAGMIAFKRYGTDAEDHAGIVTDVGTVIHSSSTQGGRGVVETPLTSAEGWDLLAIHRYIEVGGEAEEGDTSMTAYQAKVVLRDGNKPGNYLAVRSAPDGERIGRIEHGTIVTVLSSSDKWAFVTKEGGVSGYVHAQYLQRIETDIEDEREDLPDNDGGKDEALRMVVIDEEGSVFYPTGRITIEMRKVED